MKELMRQLDIETINSIIENQLAEWPEARKNFDMLARTRRKPLQTGDFSFFAQCNPGRIRSTAAKTDAVSVAARPCFLCRANRPREQHVMPWIEGWELLVNPFPILPVHFTIVASDHRPQAAIPVDMAAMADLAPDLLFFFNGAKAGASAPDHLHCQAVLKNEVPLVSLIERLHPSSGSGIMTSEQTGARLPFYFVSAVIRPDSSGMQTLAKMCALGGRNRKGDFDPDLVNAFFWKDDTGLLRVVVVPRSAHRPDCFYAEGDEKMTVSPGALDMAGIIVLPREEDFEKIDSEKAAEIFSQVGL